MVEVVVVVLVVGPKDADECQDSICKMQVYEVQIWLLPYLYYNIVLIFLFYYLLLWLLAYLLF